MAKTLTRKAIHTRYNGHRMTITTLPAGDLRDFTQIDLFDPALPIDDPNQGYQREPEEGRQKAYAKYLMENQGKVPLTPLILSSRDHLMTYNADGEVVIADDDKLFVVDGQHRKGGAEYAIYAKHSDFLLKLDWPVMIIEGLTKSEEMRLFAIVNGTAKSVRTDLVNMILTQLVNHEGEDAVQDKDVWKVIVTRALDIINRSDPWSGRVALPSEHSFTKQEVNADPSLANMRLVRATSFMTSLKPVYSYLEDHGFLSGSMEDRGNSVAQIVLDFWRALEEINPKLFEKADDFVIQKTPGIFALHGLLLHLMRTMYSARREWSKDGFLTMLDNSSALFSEAVWNKADGEASKYGSMKGFAELTRILWATIQR